MRRSHSNSQSDYQNGREKQHHSSSNYQSSHHQSNHQSNHSNQQSNSHVNSHSNHQSDYHSHHPNSQSSNQSNHQSNRSNGQVNHDSKHYRQARPDPSPVKSSVSIDDERPSKRARVEPITTIESIHEPIQFEGDSLFDDLDVDDDEREAREQREAEERRRRRAEILAKHHQNQPLDQTPNQTSVDVQKPVDQPKIHSMQSNNESVSEPEQTVSTQRKPVDDVISQISHDTSMPIVSSQEDDFDIFSDSPSLLMASSITQSSRRSADQVSGILESLDTFDDSEGYYKFRAGDILSDDVTGRKFHVLAFQGQGVFSTVLRCREIVSPSDSDNANPECCIKIIRANSTMQAAGEKEKEFLTRLALTDPSHRSHVMALLHSFYHRSHLCLVVPAYAMDFRRVIRKFGSVGLSISAVQIFTKQLLQALQVMQNAQVIHCDLKPDNILVNDAMNSCAVCDFGSASYVNDASPAPYLVSRFYRSPEVMIGLAVDCRVDLWSVGTVIYELYTGKILFNGADNNEMLHLIQMLKGPMSLKMLKRGKFAGKHFNAKGEFLKHRIDPATNQSIIQLTIIPNTPVHNLSEMIRSYSLSSALKNQQEARKIRQLTDFIDGCLHVDPNRRPSIEQLMKHPFLVGEENNGKKDK